MDDAGDRRLSTIVYVCHGARYGSRGRYSAEQRSGEVSQSLTYQLCIGVVVVAYNTVGNGGREQRLDGSENGDSECRRHKTLYCLPVQAGKLRLGQLCVYGETVADGLN